MFTIVSNHDGTFRIEVKFEIIEKFRHHRPSWWDKSIGETNQRPILCWFCVEDRLTGSAVGEKLLNYQSKYSKLINEIENDDTRWDEFPFKSSMLTYIKY